MHDIRFIRDQAEAFDRAMQRRGLPPAAADILKLDTDRRAAQTTMQALQARRNDVSKQIGALKAKGGNADELMQEVAAIKDKMAGLEDSEKQMGGQLETILSSLPNLPAADVPDGKDEHDNKELRRSGDPRGINIPRQHFELGEDLGLMDFNTAAKLSGARFTILKGALARMERALGNFMLDIHTTEFGYTEVSPPLMVNEAAEFGVGHLPKFKADLFQTTTGLYLIPTAEVPLTNMVSEMILNRDELPFRFTAKTPCFRSEAGSAGKDTRGMLRQHQFYKVEMVSITAPDQSEAEHERMTQCAETILNRLELPFRTIVLCTGDMGFGSRKTYDIEVWMPGQNTYREISSCSNCGDFQARRMNARCRSAGEKNTEFVHTLNGSGVAVGRCLIAIMENFQQPDGSIIVPSALRPYMNGLERIGIGAMMSSSGYKRPIWALGLAVLLSACTVVHTPAPVLPARESIAAGESITVEGNQNIYAVARAHNASMREIIVLNNLKPPFALKPGQKLVLPAGASSGGLAEKPLGLTPQSAPASNVEKVELEPLLAPVALPPVKSSPVEALNTPSTAPKPVETTVKPADAAAAAAVVAVPSPSPAAVSAPTVVAPSAAATATATAAAVPAMIAMSWPLQGPIVSAYGDKGAGLVNDGINIAAPKGSPVVAAAGGTVVYAGNEMKGFGNLILVRHQKGWVTAYAHLDRMLVNKDSVVAQGDMIGTVGKTGNVPSPQLHFETRHDGKPVDPRSLIKG